MSTDTNHSASGGKRKLTEICAEDDASKLKIMKVEAIEQSEFLGNSEQNEKKSESAPPVVLQPREKEQRLIALKKQLPTASDLDAQEVLNRNDWDVERSVEILVTQKHLYRPTYNRGNLFKSIEAYETAKKHESPTKKHESPTKQNGQGNNHHHVNHHDRHKVEHKSSHSSSSTHRSSSSPSSHHRHSHHNHHHHHHSSSTSSSDRRKSDSDKKHHHHKSSSSHKKKKKKHRSRRHASSEEDTEEEELEELNGDDANVSTEQNVFDSDADSEEDSNFVVTSDRQTVLDYLNESTVVQLTSIRTCSTKKANVLVELRPFESWRDLIDKIKQSKPLNFDILNNCQELLKRRQKMSALLEKCKKIIRNLERALALTKDAPAEQPKCLSAGLTLADYQLVGLNWLIMMHKENFNGILADEMGLGKTIQVIAFLAYLKDEHRSPATAPHLVVVPSSTLDNWENEMTKWCPTLNVIKYYGSLEERKALRLRFARNGLDGVDVVLTTYHTVASLPEERKMFRTIRLGYVIFDEAHMLKNMTTQRYEYLSKINAERRILLTGTPLQNNLMELMSLLCFVMPKLFAGCIEEFKTMFQKAGGKASAATAAAAEQDSVDKVEVVSFEQTQIEQAKLVMQPFVLRRLKQDVLQSLPKKTTTVLRIQMSDSQKQKYSELLDYYRNQANLCAIEASNSASTTTKENNGMAIMMEMRKLTNHPLLMRYFFTDDKVHDISNRLATDVLYKKDNAQYIFEELAVMSDYQVFQLAQKYTVSSSIGATELENKVNLIEISLILHLSHLSICSPRSTSRFRSH